jgi:hypothetical protein
MKRILAYAVVVFVVLTTMTSCKKEYSYEKAAGTLIDSTGSCSSFEIAGNYRKNASLASDSFFVTVEVNVTKTGAYSIVTDYNNGFSFSGNGTFKQEGLQKVKLKAAGIPLKDTLTMFTCTFDTTICSFGIKVNTDTVPIVNPVETMEINTWFFTDGTDGTFHRGIIDPMSTWFKIDPVVGTNYLNILGWPGTHRFSTIDTVFLITLFLPNPVIEPGTYSITAGENGTNTFGYINNKIVQVAPSQSAFFFYSSTSYENTDFTFKIISYDPGKKLIKGDFDGSSKRRNSYSDHDEKVHFIHGSFYLQLK